MTSCQIFLHGTITRQTGIPHIIDHKFERVNTAFDFNISLMSFIRSHGQSGRGINATIKTFVR